MAGTTLVRTTLSGVRPLGVRGEPLHATHEQIRGAIGRRLGERHARLLAEPQTDDTGHRIDWYSDAAGPVVPLADLANEHRTSVLADVGALSAEIGALGENLRASASDDARLLGQALELARRRPSDDYVFLVGDQPVVVCWGYEPDAAGALLPPPSLPAVVPAPPPAATVLAAGPAALATRRPWPWWLWLLAGLLALALLLGTAWLLRHILPADPDVAVTQLPPPPAPRPPPAPPDPSIGLRDDIGKAQAEEEKLKATLASLREEFATKRAQCKPPEPPKPPDPPKPPVVERKPDPPKPPVVAQKPPEPPKPPPPPNDGLMRMPNAPTNDYSFLKGCWRTDTFKHGPAIKPGYALYCFDAAGNGSMEFRFENGVTCRAPATARFGGSQLAIVDADASCTPSGRWAQDKLFCTQGAGGVANCTGSNRTERWTVNLHRVGQ